MAGLSAAIAAATIVPGGLLILALSAATLLIFGMQPRLFALGTVAVLGAAPYTAIDIRGYNVPVIVIGAPLAATAAIAEALYRPRRLLLGARVKRGTLAIGALFLLTGTVAFLLTNGANGVDDFLEWVKWASVATLVVPACIYDARWARQACQVFAVAVTAGAAYALATLSSYGPTLLEWLGNLGYLRTGNDQRYVIVAGVAQSLRAAGPYNDPNIAGIFFLCGIGAAAAFRWRPAQIGISAVLLVGCAATLSRGALFGLVVAVLAMLIIVAVTAWQRVMVVLGVAMMVSVLLIIPSTRDRLTGSLSPDDLGATDRLTQLSIFIPSMDGVWLAGYGFGRPEFRDSAAAFRVSPIADAPLASVYRGGITAGIGFLLWYCLAVMLAIRSLRSNHLSQVLLGASLLGFCATALTGYSTALTIQVVALFALWIGFASSLGSELQEVEARLTTADGAQTVLLDPGTIASRQGSTSGPRGADALRPTHRAEPSLMARTRSDVRQQL